MTPKPKILLIEDNPINRAMLTRIIQSEYRAIEATDGAQGLEMLRADPSIALVLLDLHMPVMDGYAFLAAVQKDPVLAAIPVIVTTQSSSEEDEVQSLARGATDFVSKPYKPQIILHRIASILRLRDTVAMLKILQYDSLTNIYTKDFFCHRVQEELLRHPDKKYNLICSDVVNFKLINDVFGVQAGDRLLQQLADFYRNQIGDRGLYGRYGADQFIALVEQRPYDDAYFADISDRINAMPIPRHLEIKWGIYPINDPQTPVAHMCDRALMAIKSIKNKYGRLYSVYDDTLRSRLLREQSITDSMEAALNGGQFRAFLQPKYSLKTGKLAGAEALVRWIHPEWGVVSPGEFIPLFEENGFITRLDQFIWERACYLLRHWLDAGLPVVPVSVNVSRADVYQADLPALMPQLVEKYNLKPELLHLEITESAFTEDTQQVIHTVEQLRAKGFVIEMDDFGSGYSSLNMLGSMQLDILKLDMKFIQCGTQSGQGMLRFVMDLARWMNLRVIAEGVETKEQTEWLQAIDCDYVQGFYFARPMPSADFEKLLQPGETEPAPQAQKQKKDTTPPPVCKQSFFDTK